LFFGRTLLLRLQGYQTYAGAGVLAPGLANAVLVQHFVLGMFAHLFRTFSVISMPTRKAFVLRTDAAFAAPGLPNLCWCRNGGSRASKRCVGAAFRARDVCAPFSHLFSDFGSLLEKHLFLGRTLLLRLQGYQTCVGAGMVFPGLANAVLMQHLVSDVERDLFSDFGSLLEKHLFLGRTLLLRLQGYQTCAGAGMQG
jgi:hypothetical protein